MVKGKFAISKVAEIISPFIVTNKVSCINMYGPLAQLAERGANNAKVMSSRLIRTIHLFFIASDPLSFYLFLSSSL